MHEQATPFLEVMASQYNDALREVRVGMEAWQVIIGDQAAAVVDLATPYNNACGLGRFDPLDYIVRSLVFDVAINDCTHQTTIDVADYLQRLYGTKPSGRRYVRTDFEPLT